MDWQIAWDEYMSTGIDPTGCDQGPDFDPVTGICLDELEEGEVISDLDKFRKGK